MIRYEYRLKEAVGYRFHAADVKWTPRTTSYLSSIAFICGLMAGLLGIGGGTIYNPLFVKMGKHPLVASATGMYLVMVTAISTLVQYIYAGFIYYDYAGWVSMFVIAGSLIGQMGVNSLVKSSGRPSVVLFFLCFVMFLTLIMVPVYEITTILNDSDKRKTMWHFNSYC